VIFNLMLDANYPFDILGTTKLYVVPKPGEYLSPSVGLSHLEMGEPWLLSSNYPLVNIQKAIEHGSLPEGISQ